MSASSLTTIRHRQHRLMLPLLALTLAGMISTSSAQIMGGGRGDEPVNSVSTWIRKERDSKQITRGGVGVGTAVTLNLRTEPLPYQCCDSTLRHAWINVNLRMGKESYEMGTNDFKDEVEFTVDFLQDGNPTPVSTQICTLIVETNNAGKIYHPEAQFRYDFRTVHPSIDHIKVTISNWPPNTHSLPAQQDPALYFDAWFTEEWGLGARNVDSPTDSVMLGPEFPAQPALNVEDNPLTFKWKKITECYDTIANYQFQLLRLFATEEGDTVSDRTIHAKPDWSQALTIETGSPDTTLTLTISEGKGFYAWRVRAIGSRYIGGIANDRNWGVWSEAPLQGTTIELDAPETGTDPLPSGVFFYVGFDENRNWMHQRVLTEGDEGVRIGEKMTYASGLMNVRQTQSVNREYDTTLISGTYLDYNGRPVLTTLPTPDDGVSLFYREGLAQHNSGSSMLHLYGPQDYDSLNTWHDPRPINVGLLSSYYSDDNNDLAVPNSEGYPFTRTILERDGTNRVQEQSGVGETHRIRPVVPIPSRTTRTLYGSPSDQELIRLFGDEAPNAETVHKIVTIDPNNVGSVAWVSKEGNTIATALLTPTGEHETLLALDNETAVMNEDVVDTIRDDKVFGGGRGVVAGKRIILPTTMPITLDYELSPKSFENDCGEFCANCDYTVVFRVVSTNDMNTPIVNESITITGGECLALTNQPWTWMTPPLDPGTYIVERRVYTHNINPATELVGHEGLGVTYLDGYLNQIATDTRAEFDDELEEVYLRLDSIKHGNRKALRRLYDYLEGEWGPPVDGVFRKEMGECCTIEIPRRLCDEGLTCDTNAMAFEAYLMAEIGPSGRYEFHDGGDVRKFGDYIYDYFGKSWTGSDWVPRISTHSYFGPNGSSLIDTLIRNMIKDGYDCELLWNCWRTVVGTFPRSATFGTGDPAKLNPEYSLIDEFLNCVGRKLEGYTPTAYGFDGAVGFVTHAHRFFKYTACSTLISPEPYCLCETQYGLDPSTLTSTDHEKWNQLRLCALSIMYPSRTATDSLHMPSDCGDTCGVFILDSIHNRCEHACEAMRGSIIMQLIQEYHAQGKIVQGDRYDTSGVIPLPADTTFDVSWWDLQCVADHMIAECKAGCQLTIIRDTSGSIDSLGTWDEWQKIKERLSYKLEIRLSDTSGSCDSGFVHLEGESVSAKSVVESELNRRLDDFRTTMPLGGGWFNVKNALRLVDPDFAALVQSWQDSLVWVAPGYGRFEIRDTCTICELYDFRSKDGADHRSLSSVVPDTVCWCYLAFIGDTSFCGETISGGEGGGEVVLPHPLIDSLNRWLDMTWGMQVGTSDETDCNGGGIYTRLISTDTVNARSGHYNDSLGAWRFGCVNGFAQDTFALGNMFLLHDPAVQRYAFSTGSGNPLRLATIDLRLYTPSGPFPTVFPSLYHGQSCVENLAGDSSNHLRVRLIPVCDTVTGLQCVVAEYIIANCDSTFQILDTLCWSEESTGPDDRIGHLFEENFTDRVGRFEQDIDGTLIFIPYPESILTSSSSLPDEPEIVRFCGLRLFSTSSRWFGRWGDDSTFCGTRSCGDLCYRWVPYDTAAWKDESLDTLRMITCEEHVAREILSSLHAQTEECIEKRQNGVEMEYKLVCTDPSNIEDNFYVKYGVRHIHFTLYYYDRAGNLVRTVPPHGVDLSSTSRNDHPDHKYVTQYEYTSLKWLVKQQTPDGGVTEFWQDKKGRVRFAQTARQKEITPERYSYTCYDRLGRTIESGEAMSRSVKPFQNNTADVLFPAGNEPIIERTTTTYTVPLGTGTVASYLRDPNRPQRYLQNRVSYAVTYRYNSTLDDDSTVTAYSYDPHGNVEWMMTRTWGLGESYVRYRYDLYSGLVRELFFNEGYHDQYGQRYSYDVDNRISLVESSRDGVIWDRDARYLYFAHGPLRRVELGEDSVQGMDYVNTIQGWIKGVNFPGIGGAGHYYDPGRDSIGSLTVHRQNFPADAFGMTLTYYEGDFRRRKGTFVFSYSPFNSSPVGPTSMAYFVLPYQLNPTANLYNGNIGSWMTMAQGTGASLKYEVPTGHVYRYDLLNRLKSEDFRWWDATLNSGGTPPGGLATSPEYSSSFTYDPAGNILTLQRSGYQNGAILQMDNLSYNYHGGGMLPPTNKLSHVTDAVPAGDWAEDIDDQSAFAPAGTYVYDGSGNLIRDRQAGTWIRWNGQGKVEEVKQRNATTGKSQTIKYLYNPAGNRVRKIVINDHDSADASVTYYVRDANEEVVAIYTGDWHFMVSHSNCTTSTAPPPYDWDCDGVPNGSDNCPAVSNPIPGQTDMNDDGVGDICQAPCSGYDPWRPNYDGDALPDDCDPYPTSAGSDPDEVYFGAEPGYSLFQTQSLRLADWHIYGSAAQGRIAVARPDTIMVRDFGAHVPPNRSVTPVYTRVVRYKDFELKDHLGNVRVTVSDMKLIPGGGTAGSAPFIADVRTVQHYYAFGMLQPGRHWEVAGDSSRYGYNGKEKNEEVYGTGAEYDYGFRIHDPRLARFLSLDPLAGRYPSHSPYEYTVNNPICFIDPKGKDVVYFNTKGEEIERIISNERFETYIRVRNADGTISNNLAPMPGLVYGREGGLLSEPKYQAYDHIIAAQVWIFNHLPANDLPTHTNGERLTFNPGDLNPTLVKAIIAHESTMGTAGGGMTGRGKTDLMQVGIGGDLGSKPNALGQEYKDRLNTGVPFSANESIYYGIRWLFVKGLLSPDATGEAPLQWKGWPVAAGKYGPGSKEATYAQTIFNVHLRMRIDMIGVGPINFVMPVFMMPSLEQYKTKEYIDQNAPYEGATLIEGQIAR